MLITISPAKTLDYTSELPSRKHTQPRFLDQSQTLVDVMADYSMADIRELMKVSEKIAELNAERFSTWAQPFTPDNARPAVFAFKGDVYEGLDAYAMTAKDLDFAQKHLRILSGLYGALRPLDLIQPYRLEMGVRLQNPQGKNLYEYWGDSIAVSLGKDLSRLKSDVLLNLASNEYFRAVKPSSLAVRVVNVHFRDWKNGQYKMISFFAKKARGLMSRYIITERIEQLDAIRGFDVDGYAYNASLSSDNDWVFTRKQ